MIARESWRSRIDVRSRDGGGPADTPAIGLPLPRHRRAPAQDAGAVEVGRGDFDVERDGPPRRGDPEDAHPLAGGRALPAGARALGPGAVEQLGVEVLLHGLAQVAPVGLLVRL